MNKKKCTFVIYIYREILHLRFLDLLFQKPNKKQNPKKKKKTGRFLMTIKNTKKYTKCLFIHYQPSNYC